MSGAARRWLLAVVTAGLVLGPSLAASASTTISPSGTDPAVTVPAPEAEGDDAPVGDEPETDGGGLFQRGVEAICPSTDPPAPEPPVNQNPVTLGGAGAEPIDVGGEERVSFYALYGTAGLRWTTYDQSCLSLARYSSATASEFNRAATTMDATVNTVSSYALDAEASTPIDGFMSRAAESLGGALFTPWALLGVAVAGLTAGAAVAVRGSLGGAVAVVGSVAVVLGMVSAFTANPLLLPRAADAATVGVATRVSDALVEQTGGSGGGVSPVQSLPETYYRATSYQAWLAGMFCGDRIAEAEYGPRFLEAQAFTVDEWARAVEDAGYQQELVDAKGERWLQAAADLQAERPATFACWSGETDQRGGAAAQHWVVTVIGGFINLVAAGAIAVLRNVIRVGVLLVIAFGAVMLAMRSLTAGMLQVILMGTLGAMGVSALSSMALIVLSSTLATPAQSVTLSVAAVLFFVIALLWLRKPLGRMLAGATDLSAAADVGRRGGRQMGASMRRGSRVTGNDVDGPELGGVVAGAAAGGVAGAAGAAGRDGDDGQDGGRGGDGAPGRERAADVGVDGDEARTGGSSVPVEERVEEVLADEPRTGGAEPVVPVGADGRYDYSAWRGGRRVSADSSADGGYVQEQDRAGDVQAASFGGAVAPAGATGDEGRGAAGQEESVLRTQPRDFAGMDQDMRTTAAREALARSRGEVVPVAADREAAEAAAVARARGEEPLSAGAEALARVRGRWAGSDGGDAAR